MGRHVIGYEIQRVLAAVDWFASRRAGDAKVAVAGNGEGGHTAFFAAALDERIDVALVSIYAAVVLAITFTVIGVVTGTGV